MSDAIRLTELAGMRALPQITGTLSALDLLSEFEFYEGVILPDADGQTSFVIYDTENSILIMVSGVRDS